MIAKWKYKWIRNKPDVNNKAERHAGQYLDNYIYSSLHDIVKWDERLQHAR